MDQAAYLYNWYVNTPPPLQRVSCGCRYSVRRGVSGRATKCVSVHGHGHGDGGLDGNATDTITSSQDTIKMKLIGKT